MKLIKRAVEFGDSVLDILFPPVCFHCRQPEKNPLCQKCIASFPRVSPPVCSRCGRSIPTESSSALCSVCWQKKEFPIHSAITVWIYESDLRDVIHAFKYDGRKSLGIPLGRELGIRLSKYDYLKRHLDMIIPVPLHPRKKWERGYNQSELIAREVSKELLVSVNDETLIRNRYTRANYLLDREERKANIQGAFEVRYPDQVNGKTMLVIDDILTTMTTVEECARVLHVSGAKRVYAAALARD